MSHGKRPFGVSRSACGCRGWAGRRAGAQYDLWLNRLCRRGGRGRNYGEWGFRGACPRAKDGTSKCQDMGCWRFRRCRFWSGRDRFWSRICPGSRRGPSGIRACRQGFPWGHGPCSSNWIRDSEGQGKQASGARFCRRALSLVRSRPLRDDKGIHIAIRLKASRSEGRRKKTPPTDRRKEKIKKGDHGDTTKARISPSGIARTQHKSP